MKNRIVVFFVAILISCLPTLAQQSTDVSTLSNVLYSKEMTIYPGMQLALPIYMKNEGGITLFQTDIYVPMGFSFSKKTNGRYAVSMMKTRLTEEDDDHAISGNVQPDGSLRILCSSQGNFTFDGNDGQVAVVLIDVAETVEPGKYEIKLNKQRMVRPSNDGANVSEYSILQTVKPKRVMNYDVNGDGIVDISDVTDLVDYILGK